MGMIKRFLEEYCESQHPGDYKQQDRLFKLICDPPPHGLNISLKEMLPKVIAYHLEQARLVYNAKYDAPYDHYFRNLPPGQLFLTLLMAYQKIRNKKGKEHLYRAGELMGIDSDTLHKIKRFISIKRPTT